MEKKTVLAIRRDDRFSPNSVEKDRAVLQAVCDRLREQGDRFEVLGMMDESLFAIRPVKAHVYLSMARSPEVLSLLETCRAEGAVVVNSGRGVARCRRVLLDRLMREHHIPMPPDRGTAGYWLKRGDAAAQSASDVVFCATDRELEQAVASFRERGIGEMVVSAHVVGDLIKFYGVAHGMFRYFYPSDDGISKFGDERRNGAAHHYAFDANRLRTEAERLAEVVGIEVYGGDAIVEADGRFSLIDFNDWPSFSRCRDEAAEAVAALPCLNELIQSRAHSGSGMPEQEQNI